MRPGRPDALSRHLTTLARHGTAIDTDDAGLLARFLVGEGNSADIAFEALLGRHGPMVLGVCRRMLHDGPEVDDAFQATFLLLVKKAKALSVGDSLGPWLHEVARRVSLDARSAAQRRNAREDRNADPAAIAARPVEWDDTREVIDEAIQRLPVGFRSAVVLCDLEGMTIETAARQLGWPPGTVRSRLARGRDRLRAHLTRRGFASPARLLTAALGARQAIPDALLASTLKTASASSVPEAISLLSDAAAVATPWGQLKPIVLGVSLAFGLAVGAATLAFRGSIREPQTPERTPLSQTPQASKAVAGADDRWTKRLGNGATVRVVGVFSSTPGRDEGRWWGPDGLPLREAPCDPPDMTVMRGKGQVVRAIAVRTTGLPAGAESDWSVVDSTLTSRRTPTKRGGKVVPDLSLRLVELPDGASKCTLGFEIDRGIWRTLGRSDGRAPSSGVTAGGDGYIIGEAVASGSGTFITVAHGVQGGPFRVVAVGLDGKEIEIVPATRSTSARNVRQIETWFDLSPTGLREFRFQTRPTDRFQIGDVAVDPIETP